MAMGKRAQSTETDVLKYTTQKGDMFKYEKTLPSLPVPPLAQTLERYTHTPHTTYTHTRTYTHTIYTDRCCPVVSGTSTL